MAIIAIMRQNARFCMASAGSHGAGVGGDEHPLIHGLSNIRQHLKRPAQVCTCAYDMAITLYNSLYPNKECKYNLIYSSERERLAKHRHFTAAHWEMCDCMQMFRK